METTLNNGLNKTAPERFHRKYEPVPESGCWLWTDSWGNNGYGMISMTVKVGKYVPVLAHRLSWVLRNGAIPDGLFVCHKCDTPACVNPDHLFLGTAKDNSDDRDKKGRTNRVTTFIGTAHPMARLTEDQVLAIYHSKKRTRDLIKEFPVSGSLIWAIRKGRIWKTITQKEIP